MDSTGYIAESLTGTIYVISADGSQSKLTQGSLIEPNSSLKVLPNSVIQLSSQDGSIQTIENSGLFKPTTNGFVLKSTTDALATEIALEDQQSELDAIADQLNTLDAPAAGSPEGDEQLGDEANLLDATPLLISTAEEDIFGSNSRPTITELDASTKDLEANSNAFKSLNNVTSFEVDQSSDLANNIAGFDGSETIELAPSIAESYVLRPSQVNEDRSLTQTGDSGTRDSFTATTLQTEFGEFSLAADGTWRYALNNELNEVQSLKAGQTLTEEINYTSLDGDNYSLTMVINGNNDAAVIQGDNRASLGEDSVNQTQGSLSISDIDQGEAQFKAIEGLQTSYGSFSISADGQWQYQLNNDSSAVQSLKAGEQVADTFAATSIDGSREIIKITIQGQNDAPIISGSNQSAVTLSNTLSADGKLSISDADFGESSFVELDSINAQYGTGSISEDGQWQYQADPAHQSIQALKEGNFLYDTFSVTTADGSTQDVIVKILGSDTPIFENTPNTEITSGIATTTQDLYLWTPNDDSHESIEGFATGSHGDTLVLSDLLSDSHNNGLEGGEGVELNDLDSYLHFTTENGETTLHIDPTGGFSQEGTTDQSSTLGSHSITLENLDLSSFGNSDTEIIQTLIDAGNLEILGLG